ncbi:hypothetical protein [Nonomuraea recticatena]
MATEVCTTEEPVLEETDGGAHYAACHHWPKLAERADPTAIFRTNSEITP